MGVFSLFNFTHLNLGCALEDEAPLFPGGNLPFSQRLRSPSEEESSAEMLCGVLLPLSWLQSDELRLETSHEGT